jgi:hypothetical protein
MAAERQQPEAGGGLPDRLRLPLSFDPVGLAADLGRIDAAAAEEWTPHFVERNYRGDWSALALRAPVGAVHPIMRIASNPDCRDWEDTALLRACPHHAAALATFRCPLEAVRLMRLAPGSAILEHRDHDLAAEEGRARLHVPIVTNDRVDFRLNGVRVDMSPGSCWYLRLADPHAVTNDGDRPRVHLVIDALVDPWLAALLATAAAIAGKAQACAG